MLQGIKLTAVAAALAITSSAAVANEGWYAGINGGVTYLQDVTVTDHDTARIGRFKFKAGYNVNGAVGYRMDQLRGEVAVGYQHNKLSELNVTSILTNGSTGKLTATTYMGNVYYHFTEASDYVEPYIGVGLGAATVKYNGQVPNNLNPIDGKATRFAVQGIGGVAFNVADNVDMTVDYRYLQTAKKDGFSYRAHSGNVGVVIYFA